LPTLPEGTIQLEHVWKKFRADLTVPLFYDQLKRLQGSLKSAGRRNYRWVLKDINLDVKPGESVALVGINGSGKTTLLKIISQVTYQSAGRCQVQGHIGALLSVSSGLHPDLTGKENVYLYGAVLGINRATIRKRFDEIVDFAGLTDAINRQVKFFSLGMQMRLGFSVSAFLEPDVLLVDEFLAVGDANFQQKCLARIREIVRMGTTLLYVSHDLASVEASCERAIWLADAVVQAQGPTKGVVEMYRTSVEQSASMIVPTDGKIRALKAEIRSADDGPIRSEADVDVRLTVNAPESLEARIFIGGSQGTAFPMFVVSQVTFIPEGDFEIKCRLTHLPLPKGHFSLWCCIDKPPSIGNEVYLPWQPVTSFDAFGAEPRGGPEGVLIMTPVYVRAEWEIN
jgi:ABC-type polysaccharide/polyol phosphate transport system ATPase subunit